MMSEFAIILCTVFVVGVILGSYFTMKWLAWVTHNKRHAREDALNEIASHKWHTGDNNDAVIITRIALKGLAGE